jgi:hypothetical protein
MDFVYECAGQIASANQARINGCWETAGLGPYASNDLPRAAITRDCYLTAHILSPGWYFSQEKAFLNWDSTCAAFTPAAADLWFGAGNVWCLAYDGQNRCTQMRIRIPYSNPWMLDLLDYPYYWNMWLAVNRQSLNCTGGTLSPASVATLPVGDSRKFILNTLAGASMSDVAKVVFSPLPTNLVGLNPLEDLDGSDGFATTVTALATGGPVTLTADIYLAGDLLTPKCSTTATITQITPPGAWWQTRNGDLLATTDLRSSIPITAAEPRLATGVVFYGLHSSYNLGAGTTPWLVNLSLPTLETYTQLKDRFANLTPLATCKFNNLVDFPRTSGAYLCRDKLEIKKAWTINGTKKILLFADQTGDSAEIIEDVAVETGSFLLVAAAGNLTIDKKVTNLQGFYFAQGSAVTGQDKEPLTLAGALIAHGGVNFQREGKTLTDPAELFLYRPDLWLNAPRELWTAVKTWQELAP